MGKALNPRPRLRVKKTAASKIASTAPAIDPDVRQITQADLDQLFREALEDSRLRAGDLVSVQIVATNSSRFAVTSASAILRA